MSKTLEDLGYEKADRYFADIRFFNKTSCSNIEFDNDNKTVACYDGDAYFNFMTMEELKAIYQYCIDNKWI